MRVSSRYAAILTAVTSGLIAAAAASAQHHAPTPVSPPPPGHGCCNHGHGPNVRPPSIHIGGTNVHIGGTRVKVGGVHVNNHVNVNVDNSFTAVINNTNTNNNVINNSNQVAVTNEINAGSASARASAQNFSLLNNSASAFAGGGGFVAGGTAPASTAVNLNLAAGSEVVEEERTRVVEGWRVIRAVCVDDTGTPHPASRPDPDERVSPEFEGELFRCMSGTAMHVSIGEDEAFDDARSFSCQKGEALRHRPGGEVYCAAEEARRNCNERSLLRRWGPGLKYVYTRYEERYTERVERRVANQSGGLVLMLDGGVGGYR